MEATSRLTPKSTHLGDICPDLRGWVSWVAENLGQSPVFPLPSHSFRKAFGDDPRVILLKEKAKSGFSPAFPLASRISKAHSPATRKDERRRSAERDDEPTKTPYSISSRRHWRASGSYHLSSSVGTGKRHRPGLAGGQLDLGEVAQQLDRTVDRRILEADVELRHLGTGALAGVGDFDGDFEGAAGGDRRGQEPGGRRSRRLCS